MIEEDFVKWESGIRSEVDSVELLLATTLSSEPSELISDLQAIEAWNGRINAALAQSDSFLDRYKLIAMPKKQDNWSETDRKLQMESDVAPIRLVRDTLEHLCDCIKIRITLGQSILAFHRQFIETDIKLKKNNEKIW